MAHHFTMKKFYLISLFSFLFIGCSNSETSYVPFNHPYNKEHIFGFKTIVEQQDSVVFEDTLELHCLSKTWNIDVTQLEIAWKYPESITKVHTGAIVKRDSIWMHPPRSYLFTILETSAFPFIKLPFSLGNSWKWQLEVSKAWLSGYPELYKKVNSSKLTFYHSYEIIDRNTKNTKLGPINCFKVKATTQSTLGNRNAYFLYNNGYGFIQMIFETYDNKRIQMDLITIDGRTQI